MLILFTDDAIARHGMDVLRANSIESINWTNQAYRNSCVSLRVRVIGTLRSPMQESGTGIIDTQLALRTNARVAAVFIAMFREPPVAATDLRGINDAKGRGTDHLAQPVSRPDR